LVIKTSLYYDARSEKHQIVKICFSINYVHWMNKYSNYLNFSFPINDLFFGLGNYPVQLWWSDDTFWVMNIYAHGYLYFPEEWVKIEEKITETKEDIKTPPCV
jgi:hypothetical protein